MLYEVTVFGEYFSQQIINRFNYLSVGEPSPSVPAVLALAKGLGFTAGAQGFPSGSLAAAWRDLVVPNYVFRSVVVRAAADYAPTEYYEAVQVNKTGAAGGEAASPAFAYGFRTNIVRTDVARGTKRFAGVSETYLTPGGVLGLGAATVLQALADGMGAPINDDTPTSTLIFTPVVVGKQRYEPSPGRFAYRYYPTLTAQLDHLATGIVWSYLSTVRTQRSRQYGEGS